LRETLRPAFALPVVFAVAGALGGFAVVSCGTDRGAEETTGTTATVARVDVASTPKLEEAVREYRGYVNRETESLVAETEDFTSAVIEGNVEEAKEEYAPARVHWERIEPIAASLGDLDPRIDAREGDVPEDEWGGFHRIEKALWEENTTEGQEEYARRLQADVEEIRSRAAELELVPEDLVVGSIELLNEVSAGKITGEEDRYSHTDLYDINANIEGSEAAYNALEPALRERDAELADEIDARFDDVYAVLEPYRDGADGWVPYTELNENDRRELSQAVDALAEPLSQVGQVLEGQG
jgi:iron uptake system component EfeO